MVGGGGSEGRCVCMCVWGHNDQDVKCNNNNEKLIKEIPISVFRKLLLTFKIYLFIYLFYA